MRLLDLLLDKKQVKLTEEQYHLLLWINHKKIDNNFKERWNKKVGNVDNHIKFFIKKDLIQPPPIDVTLNKLYTVAELKSILERKNIKVKGRKSDLINAAIENSSPSELKKLTSKYKVYELTSQGKKVLNELEEKQKQKEHLIEMECIAALLDKTPKKAIEFIYKKYPDTEIFSLMSDGSVGLSQHTNDYIITKEVELILKLDFKDSNIPYSKHKKISAAIALYHVLGISIYDMTIKVQEIINMPFYCDDLFEFTRNNSTYMTNDIHQSIKNGDTINDFDLLNIYIHTKLFLAINKVNLEYLTKYRTGLGIKINCADDCPICKAQKRFYKWNEIHTVPKLPIHWGCRCIYTSWIN